MTNDLKSYPLLEVQLVKLAEDSRKLINESLELLRQEAPDTFLGRETHKPFPKEARVK